LGSGINLSQFHSLLGKNLVFPLCYGANKNDDLVRATDSLSVTPILLKPENLKLIEIKGVF
jgi:hypothetical protein